MISILWSANVNGQPIPSDDTISLFQIEARVRNGKTVYEGALFTPNTPPPYAQGGGPWQMNPPGSPVWNSNGNMYGDIHSFLFTYTMATGTSVWKIDFNRDGDYNDVHESVTSTAPTLIGKGFRYLNIWGQGHDIGLTAALTNFTINGVNFGSYTSSTNTPFSALFEETSGLFTNITASGNFSFSGDGGRECPRIWLRLGTTNEDPICSITSPATGTHFNLDTPVLIDATASVMYGSISKVEFYVNNIKMGMDDMSPFNFSWAGAGTPGNYTLLAKAIDSFGGIGTSSPVVIFTNTPPTCTIVDPTEGHIYFDPDTVMFTAQASDVDDSIAVVEFFVDTTFVGADSIAPYRSNAILDMPVGTYTLTARSTDSLGASTTSSPIHIYVRCVREDLDNNGTVNSSDFLIFLTPFGLDCVGCIQDFNDDGKVDSFDFLRLLALLGYTCN